MDAETHTLMDGKLHVYKRGNSRYWQCSTYMGQLNHRTSTKEESLVEAKEFARGWYMERCVDERKRRRGKISTTAPEERVDEAPANAISTPIDRRLREHKKPKPNGPLFKDAAAEFELEYRAITAGERNAHYVDQKSDQIRVHLVPFFGEMGVGDITSGTVQDYRVHRQTSRKHRKTGKVLRPSRSTLHSEIVTLRQILKMCSRKETIKAVLVMSVAYKTSGKVNHRAWFSPAEYKLLYEATRDRAKHPRNERWRTECEQMHDFVLIMGNTGLRPDEALRLEERDVAVVDDEATGETILEIAVRGKRGTGFCKSMPGAVQPYLRLRQRRSLKATDRLFDSSQRELFNTILAELNLKHDREGNVRTTYSLRHTYICMRLMEGADIYQVAKNCRTSVEMIEKHYAVHIKTILDAAAINVRKAKVSSISSHAA